MTMTGFDMKPLDELFGIHSTDSSSDFIEIPINQIDNFPNHPFKVIDNDDMLQLADSIKANGVINPAIVREKSDGRYELISGHRRKRACELAGLTTLKCVVKDISDDEATVYMVDSNFQRSKVLPSEKAFAYKMRLEAMKRQGKRTDLTSNPVGWKLSGKETAQVIGEQTGDSQTQVRRYIRLTELIPHVLDLVDNEKIKLRPAVELSYIPQTLQNVLVDVIINENVFPSQAQAEELRRSAADGNLNRDTVLEILGRKKSTKQEKDIKIPIKKIQSYFPKEYTSEQMLDEIFKLLENVKRQDLS